MPLSLDKREAKSLNSLSGGCQNVKEYLMMPHQVWFYADGEESAVSLETVQGTRSFEGCKKKCNESSRRAGKKCKHGVVLPETKNSQVQHSQRIRGGSEIGCSINMNTRQGEIQQELRRKPNWHAVIGVDKKTCFGCNGNGEISRTS